MTTDPAKKKSKIENAIRCGNTEELKLLAAEPLGLLEDSLRRKAWPIILELNTSQTRKKPSYDEITAHKYYSQVLPDVDRSIRRFPPSIPRATRLRLQDKLVSLIMRVLVANPELHYYQGYHDICVTVLLVLDGDEDVAFRIVDLISKTKLRPFMEVSMEGTIKQLNKIYPLLGLVEEPLKRFLEQSQCGVVFLLSWCITWFGHDLTHYTTLVRLFDLFLSSDELMPVYLAASIILPHHQTLLEQECSLSSVHSYFGAVLSSVDCTQGQMEQRVQYALYAYRQFPPKRLRDADRRPKPDKKLRKISKELATSIEDDYVVVMIR